MSELFRMIGAALKPSNSATPSIDYPGPKVYGQLSPHDRDITFMCSECGYEFAIDSRDYRGQFDHPPSEPICDDCKKRIETD